MTERGITNPSIAHLIQFFKYAHLPEHLQVVSRRFAEMAAFIVAGPHNQETTVALRKLLEAKDAAVRAWLCGHVESYNPPSGTASPIPIAPSQGTP